MTTIILSTKERAMAADSQVTFDGSTPFRVGYGPKIQLVKVFGQEAMLATAGNVDACLAFERAFLKAAEQGESTVDVSEKLVKKVSAILFYDDGTINAYDGTSSPMEIHGPYYGIGTGFPYAVGALYHGASLKEAVRIACLCDPYSGFGIQYVQFSGKARTKNKTNNNNR